jgi:methionyl aminopeptidase
MTAQEVITEILNNLKSQAKPGVNLLTLEHSCESLISIMGATSINKGYFPSWAKIPFPSVVCLSVNDTVNHGIPFDYILRDGDLLTIDCGINVQNVAADAGFTIPIGTISSRDERLLRYTKKALYMGISKIKLGVKITEVGKAIEKYAMLNGYVVSRRMNGHAIGKLMHEEPTIPMFNIGYEEVRVNDLSNRGYHYSFKEYDNIPVFYEGQVVCIEPHLTYKDEFGKITIDQWTCKTRDGKKSAMAEHMVKVTSLGPEILTKHIIE